MKKGFTLIELLVVILILGIIALIAMPTITSIIKDSKASAFKNSASNYIRALENKCTINKLNQENPEITITIDGETSENVDILKNIIKGKTPDRLLMTSDIDCNVAIAMYDNDINKCVYKLATEEEINISDVSKDYRCMLDARVRNDKDMYTLGYNSVTDTDIVPTDESCFGYSAGSTAINSYKDNCPKNVIIPAYIDGKIVSTIGYQAFMNKNLESVLMPETIISIGSGAFSYNNITTVGLGTQIETISDQSFAYNKLTELVLPDTLTLTKGFEKNELQTITFGSGITEIGAAAFSFNYELKEVDFSKSINLVKFNTSAFEGTGITNITLPNSLKIIGAKAFRNTKLTSITIPLSVEQIGTNAFLGVSTLTEINFIGRNSTNGMNLGTQWNGNCNNIQFIN